MEPSNIDQQQNTLFQSSPLQYATDVVTVIASFLDSPTDLMNTSLVCVAWGKATSNPLFWHSIDLDFISLTQTPKIHKMIENLLDGLCDFRDVEKKTFWGVKTYLLEKHIHNWILMHNAGYNLLNKPQLLEIAKNNDAVGIFEVLADMEYPLQSLYFRSLDPELAPYYTHKLFFHLLHFAVWFDKLELAKWLCDVLGMSSFATSNQSPVSAYTYALILQKMEFVKMFEEELETCLDSEGNSTVDVSLVEAGLIWKKMKENETLNKYITTNRKDLLEKIPKRWNSAKIRTFLQLKGQKLDDSFDAPPADLDDPSWVKSDNEWIDHAKSNGVNHELGKQTHIPLRSNYIMLDENVIQHLESYFVRDEDVPIDIYEMIPSDNDDDEVFLDVTPKNVNSYPLDDIKEKLQEFETEYYVKINSTVDSDDVLHFMEKKVVLVKDRKRSRQEVVESNKKAKIPMKQRDQLSIPKPEFYATLREILETTSNYSNEIEITPGALALLQNAFEAELLDHLKMHCDGYHHYDGVVEFPGFSSIHKTCLPPYCLPSQLIEDDSSDEDSLYDDEHGQVLDEEERQLDNDYEEGENENEYDDFFITNEEVDKINEELLIEEQEMIPNRVIDEEKLTSLLYEATPLEFKENEPLVETKMSELNLNEAKLTNTEWEHFFEYTVADKYVDEQMKVPFGQVPFTREFLGLYVSDKQF